MSFSFPMYLLLVSLVISYFYSKIGILIHDFHNINSIVRRADYTSRILAASARNQLPKALPKKEQVNKSSLI